VCSTPFQGAARIPAGTPFADPDTEAIRQAFNALVLALRR